MANSNIMTQLKELYYSLRDSNGNERMQVVGILKENSVSKSRMQLLNEVVDLVVDTDIICNEAKMYIKDRGITLKRLTSELNDSGERISDSALNGRVLYASRKLEKEIGSMAISDILYSKTKDISVHEANIAKVISKYTGGSKLKQNIMFNIDDNQICSKYSGDFFEEFGEIIKEFNRVHYEESRRIEKSGEACGYINYLLSGVKVDDEKVIEDRERLIKLLETGKDSVDSEENTDILKLINDID